MTLNMTRRFIIASAALLLQVAIASPPALAEGPFPFFFKGGGPASFPGGGNHGPFQGGDFDGPGSIPFADVGPRRGRSGFDGPVGNSGDDFPFAPLVAGIAVGSIAQQLDAPRRIRVGHYDAYDEIAFEPWTREWYAYCSKRYRTFNPETGTYKARGGKNRFCNLN
jgi:BA14K-like protein